MHHHCTYSGFDNDKLTLEDLLDEKEFVGFRASASKSRKSSSSIEFCSHILLYLSKGKRSLQQELKLGVREASTSRRPQSSR